MRAFTPFSLSLLFLTLRLGSAEDAPCEPNPLVCGGSRGRCHATKGVDICECGGIASRRWSGLRCERAFGVGAECPLGCAEHGECIHGFCECEAGWSGPACSVESWGEVDSSPFLTARALRAVVADDGSCLADGMEANASAAEAGADKPGGPRACCEPTASYRTAVYRREGGEQMARLLRALPSELIGGPGWPTASRHRTCAVVSSASSLLEAEYGLEIDSHDAVFRMNRAPTQGFEKHVGTRTSYDWLNSGPHTTSKYAVNILPRIPKPANSVDESTMLLHGTTTAPVENGSYKRLLEWVDGHLSFADFHPELAALRTRLVSIDFLHESWDSFHAYGAPFTPGTMRHIRPSSGWHTARLALMLCEQVTLYGFSLESKVGNTKFHYYDSLVQATISPDMKDPRAHGTHKFGMEHLIYANWTKQGVLKDRVRLVGQ